MIEHTEYVDAGTAGTWLSKVDDSKLAVIAVKSDTGARTNQTQLRPH